nr:type IIL restriction-modification enzyme MmeI [Castellaniella sp.]
MSRACPICFFRQHARGWRKSSSLFSADEAASLGLSKQDEETFLRRIIGSAEFIRGVVRKCLWITDEKLPQALQIASIRDRIDGVREMRLKSKDVGTNEMASRAQSVSRDVPRRKTHANSSGCVIGRA